VPLNEKDPITRKGIEVKTTHVLSFSNAQHNYNSQQRKNQYEMDHPLLVFVGSSTNKEFAQDNKETENDEGEINLAPNMKVTVRYFSDDEIFVRIHNMNEDRNITANLQRKKTGYSKLLTAIGGHKQDVFVDEVREVSLTGHRDRKELEENRHKFFENPEKYEELKSFGAVEIEPMELRAFMFKLRKTDEKKEESSFLKL